MGTSLSLTMFAVGAVFAFAVRSDPAGLDITVVGVIIMLASGVGFAWSVYRERWRHRVVEESIEQGGSPPLPIDDAYLVDSSAPVEGHARATRVVPPESTDGGRVR
jgi:hypothetical protein